MKITLVRHGLPVIDFKTRITSARLSAWLDTYEAAPLDASLAPSLALLDTLTAATAIFTSPSRRSCESARVLCPRLLAHTLTEAAEAPLPRRSYCPLPLPPHAHLLLARTIWFAGFVSAQESPDQVKDRAAYLAEQLILAANKHGQIALVAHGMINFFASYQLKRSGWRCTSASPSGYWSHRTFEPIFGMTPSLSTAPF